MKIRHHILAALALCTTLGAQQPDTSTTAYRASVSQNSLQGSTVRMKDDLTGIIRDYQRYGIAALEIEKLKEAVGSLDQISGRDMPAVVNLLLEASRAHDADAARTSLGKATGGQKEVQTRLRTLADQLALYSDQAAMQKRIEELAVRQAANLRTTRQMAENLAQWGTTAEQLQKELADMPKSSPWPERVDQEAQRARQLLERKRREWNDFTRNQQEQDALEKEIALARQAMEKVAADPMSAASHFTQALQAADSGKLSDRSKEANAVMTEDPAASGKAQEDVFNTLQKVIANLDGARSDEERLRDMATQLSDLSVKETGIANKTPLMWGGQKERATEDQFAVGDRLQVLEDRMKSLNAQTADQAAAAAKQTGELGRQMSRDDFRDNVAMVSQTADSQRKLSQNLAAMSQTLQKQADALASGGSQSSPSDMPQLSPEAAAIQEAMQRLVDGRINVELASRLNSEKGDYKPRVAAGQDNLTAATTKAVDAGAVVGPEVHKALAEAQRLAALAADGTQVDHNLYHTRANINTALAGLQEAAIQLAAQEQQNGQDKPGEGVDSYFSKKGGPIYSATSAASDAQRDALSLLKQEKTAPEFQGMVNQYIKNLTEETEPEP